MQAQVASSAELAVRVRRQTSRRGEVDRALREGRLLKTWAMRGTLHLLTPEEAGTFLSLVASGRSWERPSWQRYFGMTPKQLEALRTAVRVALESGPLTRDELATAVSAQRGLRHLGEGLRSRLGNAAEAARLAGRPLLRPESRKPRDLHAPGGRELALDAGFPIRRTRRPSRSPPTSAPTGRRRSTPSATGWPAAGSASASFEPGSSTSSRRLVEVDVDGERAYVLAEDVDELASTEPTTALRLLPGFDQYVLGPGTGDGHVVPASRRAAVSRQAGWISPVVVAGGVVCGTWELDGDDVRVAWFAEAGKPPRTCAARRGRTALRRSSSATCRPVTTMT